MNAARGEGEGRVCKLWAWYCAAQGVMRGKGRLPVADYTLATQVLDQGAAGSSGGGGVGVASATGAGQGGQQEGVASCSRGVYSFCM